MRTYFVKLSNGSVTAITTKGFFSVGDKHNGHTITKIFEVTEYVYGG